MIKSISFDIETIPSQNEWVREYYEEKIGEPEPPKNLKKQETIDKWFAENPKEALVEEAINKAGFSGATNHICCISWSTDGFEIKNAYIKDDVSKEADMLQKFFDDISQCKYGDVFVGHNIIGFDLRVIKQRAMVLGVKIPSIFPTDPKPWDKNVYDTMLKWDSRDFIKMDLIARAFGIQGKGAVDGSMVYPMWQEGKYAEIAEYCDDDVRMTIEVYKHMTFNK